MQGRNIEVVICHCYLIEVTVQLMWIRDRVHIAKYISMLHV